jgi:hypothetical protein
VASARRDPGGAGLVSPMPRVDYSDMHRNILDVFNEYGVQIMTPAYEGDPEEPKVVPRERWYAPPAEERAEALRRHAGCLAWIGRKVTASAEQSGTRLAGPARSRACRILAPRRASAHREEPASRAHHGESGRRGDRAVAGHLGGVEKPGIPNGVTEVCAAL